MKKLNSPELMQDSSADSNPSVSTTSPTSRNENDSAEGFIIGALLFSLLGSTRSEAVSVLLPNEE
ncbi:MAG: hypothetical protein JST85_07355 [Acidobacteria bacterium]|nr:hypothetical protein [Acidobacteriota bacterium]